MRFMAAEVRAEDAHGGTAVKIVFEYRSKLGPLVDQLAKLKLRQIARENFDTWRRRLG